ncbi:TIGR04423 family type III CRISPR-associated protein [bacterium]|nr:TIGR04423 family type III CRISPR-associated protein [bacterium]MBU1956917.1 TIGR04423 family type III CRISPR-associated protein [bacterium]
MRKNRSEIIEYINTLKEYEGFVQFSHRAIDLKKDIFPKAKDIDTADAKDGFVYEAHFCKGSESIMIRQLNADWLVSTTDISSAELETFHAISNLQINMAQIWEEEADKYCANMKVKKLKKVVFAGFKKGDKS